MKVAHITTVHPKNDNRIFFKECVTLKNSGHDVTLIVAGAQSEEREGIHIVGFEKSSSGRLMRFVKTSFLDLLKVCKTVDADLYHFHDPEIIFAGLWLKLRGKKVIYDVHENNPASILSKPYIRSAFVQKAVSKVFDLFERGTAPFFDAVVTARPDISRRFRHQRLVTLRNFPILPDLSAIREVRIEKNTPAVIFVGGMVPMRGINELIDAFGLLDGVELWLLGPVNDAAMKRRIQEGCRNVRYFGVVEAYEVFSYIKQADIGIITFLPAPNHLQTLATKPFEYMACGKPMIMSDFPYWREVFGDSSLYVDPADPEAIARTVRSLVDDRKMQEKMGKQNLELSLNAYNWEKESQKLIELYEALISDVTQA